MDIGKEGHVAIGAACHSFSDPLSNNKNESDKELLMKDFYMNNMSSNMY